MTHQSNKETRMSYDQNDSTSDVDGDGDDSVDSRPTAPVEDSRPNEGADTSTDAPAEGDEQPVPGRRNDDLPTENAEETEGGQLTHIETDGVVVGRRNQDLPVESLPDN